MASLEPSPRPTTTYSLAREPQSQLRSRWKLPEKVHDEFQQPRSRWRLPPKTNSLPCLLQAQRQSTDMQAMKVGFLRTTSVMASILDEDGEDSFDCEARHDVPQCVRVQRHHHRVRVAIHLNDYESSTSDVESSDNQSVSDLSATPDFSVNSQDTCEDDRAANRSVLRQVRFADESNGLPLEEIIEYAPSIERRVSRLSDFSLDSDEADGVALVSMLANLR